jgi:hypothetical protein
VLVKDMESNMAQIGAARLSELAGRLATPGLPIRVNEG